MKRLTISIFSILLLFGLEGCGSNEDSSGTKIGEYSVDFYSFNGEKSNEDDYYSILVDNQIFFEKKTISNKSDYLTKEEAKDYCNNLSYSFGNWRLPTLGELNTAIDIEKEKNNILNFKGAYYSESAIYHLIYMNSKNEVTNKCVGDSLSCAFSGTETGLVLCVKDNNDSM